MKKLFYLFTAIGIGSFLFGSIASAQTANRVFATRATFSGNLGGISGADAKCQAAADSAGLVGTWYAWLSDSNSTPGSRFINSPNPYQLLNGAVVANNWTDLVDGAINAELKVDETGGWSWNSIYVWTGTNGNGTGAGGYCNNWTDGGGATGIAGGTNLPWYLPLGQQWTNYSNIWCSTQAKLYCFEQAGPKNPPSAPQNFKGVSANGRIGLSWSAPLSTGGSPITGYKIYRGTSAGGESFLVQLGNVQSYADVAASNGVTYYYKISAVNAVGESSLSSEISGMPFLQKLVFITSTAYNGALGGVSGADAKCQAAADSGGLGGAWRAWLSDGSTPASSRLSRSNDPYRLINGSLVANNWTDLTDGSLVSPINISEKGTTVNSSVWTNTTVSGANANSNNCDSWFWNRYGTYGDSLYGSTGHSSFSNSYWTSYSNGYCSAWSGGSHLYCIEQIPSPPTVPTNVSASFGDRKVTLSWKAPDFTGIPNVSNYKIYRGTVSGGQILIATVDGNTLSYADTGLTNGTKYYYKVSAVNTIGESQKSSEVVIEPTKALKIFVTSQRYNGNLGGVAGGDAKCQAAANSVGMGGTYRSLLDNFGTNLSSTTVLYKTLDGTTIANGTKDLLDGSLLGPINRDEFGQQWTSATDSSGNPVGMAWVGSGCSGWTQSANWGYTPWYTTFTGTVGNINDTGGLWMNNGNWGCSNNLRLYCAELDPFEAPKDLVLTIVNGKITLNWKAPVIGGSQGYKIYRSASSNSQTDSPIATVSGGTLTFTDNSATDRSVKYFYKIKSIRPEGDSNFSNEVAAPALPGIPTSVSANSAAGAIILNWTVPDAGGAPISAYKIYRGDAPGTEVFYTQVSASSMVCCDSNYNLKEVIVPPYTDAIGTSSTNRKRFYYKISAVNSVGESSLSSGVNAMPLTVPSIKNINATPGEGRVTLNWQVDDGGSPLITAQSTDGAFLYGIDYSPNGGLIGQSLTNSATIELSSNQLNPPQNQYFGIYAQNAVGRSEYGEVYATPRHLSGTWTNVSGFGNTNETCRQWLSRTGQLGKRIRHRSVGNPTYSSDNIFCAYYSGNCTAGDPNAVCVGLPLGVCTQLRYGSCSGSGFGMIGVANKTGNAHYISRYGESMGQALLSYYNLNFFPTAGYIGSEDRTQTLQGSGPLLTVTKSGIGTGVVTGTGINCGATCSTNYVQDDSYSFTATPDADSVFSGWTGDCSGAGTNPTCNLVMDSNKTITANFGEKPKYDLTVAKAGSGDGVVSSSPAGISCGGDCTEQYVVDTMVTLTATPAPGFIFSGWSGPCGGTGTCNLNMNDVKLVIATFDPPSYLLQVTKTGDGSGSVTSSPGGINCGGDCSENFTTGSTIILTPTAASGSQFDNWTGSCTGSGTCILNMDSPKNATAAFSQVSFQATTTPGGIQEVRP